ncbi:alpha/beta fold hydrolase [Propionivibrio soli]|uniref:alpha/beta fold hydrolase n=1 Tax=Propionivibrio soli TaxID=2976531 RepID=UPI0021E800B8|nr:alpha/beta hydrolase [Propionivibrio soli]
MAYSRSRTEKVDVRGVRYNVRHWGPADAPVVFFLHGWMDCSPTFQFLVDALSQPWHVIAPDWRGYGESEWLSRPYWHADYYADLDCLLDHYSPGRPARIVGHSMGANISAVYAGVRPQRVAQLVMLDFLGLKPPVDDDSPALISKWLHNVQEQPRLSVFNSSEALAARLMDLNPRLTESRAAFLSWNVSRVRMGNVVEMACDPWHRVPSPNVYRIEDAMASWSRIEAPVLLLVATHGFVNRRFGNEPEEFARRTGAFKCLEIVNIPDSGHNVQHDQPERVAEAIEAFLARD